MKLKYFTEEKEFNSPIKLSELLPSDNTKYIAAKVNNRIRELDYLVSNDAEIEFLDITNTEAMTIYQSTLRYLIIMAINRRFKNAKVIFNYSISRSIFASVSGLGSSFKEQHLKEIEEELEGLIKADFPIRRSSVSKTFARKFFKDQKYYDKEKILKYRKEETVHLYTCEEYANYMFGYMLPSTRYLTDYKLRLYSPGFMISYPRSECGGVIPPFEDAPTFSLALKEANIWGNIAKCSSIPQMNELIEEKKAVELINLCETKHNNSLAELGLLIKEHIDDTRLIAIAGPSSSGKTTFTNRLRIELMSRGITPLMISIDNYYLGVNKAPKDENGQPDLEHVNALDVKLFDRNINDLINGETVTLPIFNFENGERTEGPTVKLLEHQPIMIEGIHALNDSLTPSIPMHKKFKIYISPQAQLHIDDHNPISLSDIRLIRRIVRDHHFRNYDAAKTISIWPSVRRGEFKWIYPYQEQANYVFNSELTYELCVMKKYLIPLLEEIPTTSEHYIPANRLIKFMKYFHDIDDKWVPCNSILREFIGGSMFYEVD